MGETEIRDHRPSSNGLRVLIPAVFAIFFAAVLWSCSEEKTSTIEDVDPEVFPTMKTIDVSTLISDSGYTRYHVTADLWLMFDDAEEPHWTFPDGIFMERYNDSMIVESTFRSDSATYLSRKRIWQFDRDVRMRNTNGDRFATEQLFWDQQQQKVYSDSFIHIERSDRTLEGYGFVSNEQMTEYTIMKVSGIFPTPQRRPRSEADSMAVDSVSSDTVPAIVAPADSLPKPVTPSRRQHAQRRKI